MHSNLFGNIHLPNTRHHLFHNGKCYVHSMSNERHRHILLVGMAFPNDIHKPWSSNYSPLVNVIISDYPFVAMILPALDKFSHISLSTNKPRYYSDSVKRDFLKELVVEYVVFPCNIYTLNNYEDKVRYGINLSTNEMNHDTRHKDFVSKLGGGGLEIRSDLFRSLP